MSPFMKGVLGFFGCAAVTAVVYHIGKSVGREETLREIEAEEQMMALQAQPIQPVIAQESDSQKAEANTTPYEIQPVQPATQQQTPVEKVRKMHGLKNKILGGGGIIKDLLQNPDNKKVLITVEEGDIVARISPK